ncbi:MAG: hypothetical protein AAF570_26145, partial [Bacteroidota bacterium]
MKPAIQKAFTLLVFLLPFFFTFGQNGTITAEMISDIISVREAAISTDGKQIAYTVRRPGGESDDPGKSWNELHICDVDGSNDRTYIQKPNSVWSINWSKDGQHIYFLSRRSQHDKNTQVYRLPIAGGEAEMVTEHDASIRSYSLSPDGKSIAYTARDGKTKEERMDAKAGKDWKVYGENQTYKFTRLYTMNLESGQTRTVFNDDMEVNSFTWSPNNSTIVFRASQYPDIDYVYMFQKIYKVAANGGTPQVVCETEGKLGHLEISPDGKMLAWNGAVDLTDPLAQTLFQVPVTGGKPQNISKDFEGSVNSFTWL